MSVWGSRSTEPPGDTLVVERELNEQENVAAWRLLALLDAGYPREVAEEIAVDLSVDLHRACEMLNQGCSLELAIHILT